MSIFPTLCPNESADPGYFDTFQAILPTYHISEQEILLFDSGVRPDPELLAELERMGFRVRAVLCTHLHPDHIANNAALVERYGAEIFSTQPERESHESWEKLSYSRRAMPLRGLQKFFVRTFT